MHLFNQYIVLYFNTSQPVKQYGLLVFVVLINQAPLLLFGMIYYDFIVHISLFSALPTWFIYLSDFKSRSEH